MQLHSARLCLDCDEVHAERECPVCASDRFAFLTRWVPAEERRQRSRPAAPPSVAETDPPRLRWAKRSAAGLALLAVSRWLWQQSKNDSRSRRMNDAGAGDSPHEPTTRERRGA